MTDRPIPFSSAMVRALLDGRKTQTRRVLTRYNVSVLGHSWRGKSCPWEGLRFAEAKVNNRLPASGAYGPHLEVPFCHPQDTQDSTADCAIYRLYPEIEIGDRLWVRETWRAPSSLDEFSPAKIGEKAVDVGYPKPWCPLRYEADEAVNSAHDWHNFGNGHDPAKPGRLRAGMHLPRWASRLTLTVTDVRVQRLQEITIEDAHAEGAHAWAQENPETQGRHPRASFVELWSSINGIENWNSNPWVVALTFTVEKRNIDA